MDMSQAKKDIFAEKVLIFFLADEDERLLVPVRRWNPDRIYIFIFENETIDINYKEKYPLIEKGIKIYCNFTEYYQVIQELSKIIKDEKERDKNVEIVMNCATGSKISAIATVDASRLWKIKTIYIYSKDYDPKRSPKHKGEMTFFNPPIFPIRKPAWLHVEVLRTIAEIIDLNQQSGAYGDDLETEADRDYVMKSRLQDTLQAKKLISGKSYEDSDRNKKSGEQMALKQQILDPLAKSGYVKLEKEARSKKVFLTEEGQIVAKIFKFYNPRD
jgi:hypothetical protein